MSDERRELRCPNGHLYGFVVNGVIELYERHDKRAQRERGERIVLRWDVQGETLPERVEPRRYR